jgi:predicted metalloprotease
MVRMAGLLLLLVLIGCGSNDKAPTATQTPTTQTPTTTGAMAPEPSSVANMPRVQQGSQDSLAALPAGHDAGFLHAAFRSAESVWEREFSSVGTPYRHGKVSFFHSTVRTPCGEQSRETGPFYCPADDGVYLNTAFFDALARAHALQSQFAAGYVTGHEVGHHVQQLLGTLQRVADANRSDPGGENARSVQVELQADCYAGIWLHTVSAAGQLTEADVADILRAAAVVGDDFQRNQAGVELAPETWTHGSSEQRQHWLSVGLTEGRPAACDTFAQPQTG